MPIRLIDAGQTSGVRSQTLYHAIARAGTDHAPDTILFVTPAEPYVSIGYHQDAKKEVDLEYCKNHRIPVIRREVGGGVVYLDSDQLFIQWVFRQDRLPWRLERRFELFAQPLVNTYRSLDMDAYFRPPNDIHVAGKKVAGLGAGSIGNAEVMVGNILFDFDCERMSRVLRVPSEEFRDRVHNSLLRYITTLRQELGDTPEKETVRQIYISECQRILKNHLKAGSLTDEERGTIEKLDARFLSDSWLNRVGGLNRPGIKIHSDVWLYHNDHMTEGGRIQAILRVRESRVDDLLFSGEIPFHPDARIRDLERAILNTELNYRNLSEIIEAFFRREGIHIPGIQAEDWVQVLLKHQGSQQEA